jgi:hypothetical protein
MTALSVHLPEDKHLCLETLAKGREAPWSPMIDELMMKKGVKNGSSTARDSSIAHQARCITL